MMWAFFITFPSSSRMALMNWVSQMDTSTASVLRHVRVHAIRLSICRAATTAVGGDGNKAWRAMYVNTLACAK